MLVVAFPAVLFCQTKESCHDFQGLVKATYNFKPSKLKDSERESKIAAMDRVWKMVGAKPAKLLPCLRAAISESGADQWFRFDGSALLVKLDPSTASKALQVRAYTDVDLDDVDLHIWVRTLAQRGVEGIDVSEAGDKWLRYPNAHYFLPQHGAYEVKIFQGALSIFGSMDEAQATPALVKVVSQPNHAGREHALWLLMMQATPEALRALKQVEMSGFSAKAQGSLRALLTRPILLSPRSGAPKTGRAEFRRAFEDMLNGDSSRFSGLVRQVPDGEKDVVAVLQPEDLPLLRKVRRLMIANANQHTVEFYNTFTDILLALTWKPELVRD
jgi:hypothetical protein